MFLARYNPPCFFDQCVGELILRNFTDHFALAEQQPLIFPSGNAQISFPRFTGPVDNTPHHRYRQRLGEILQPLLDLLSDFDQIDLAAATGGTADKTGPRSRNSRLLRISKPTRTSSTGSPVNETRRVFPIPS